MSAFPPIFALFLTIFDDHKGQTLIWKRSLSDDPLTGIEFQSLPSGLHLVEADSFSFAYSPSTREPGPPLLAQVVFANRALSDAEILAAGQGTGSRGRSMISLGVILDTQIDASNPLLADMTEPRRLLAQLSASRTLFSATLASDDAVFDPLEAFWSAHGAPESNGAQSSVDQSAGAGSDLLGMSKGVPLDHPIYYLPTLLEILGPKLCTVWKSARERQRIMIFSLPPLQPVCQTAWLVWALGSIANADERNPSEQRIAQAGQDWLYVGNVGLMELDNLKQRKGGWVASTSDAIFKDRPQLYDLLIDFSDVRLPALSLESTPAVPLATPVMYRTIQKGSGRALKSVSYAFADLPLYRDLRSAATSAAKSVEMPPGPPLARSSTFSSIVQSTQTLISPAWLWLFAYGAYETICEVCWGVCKLATGQLYLEDGEAHVHEHDSSMARGMDTGLIRLPEDDELIDGLEDDSGEDESAPLVQARRAVSSRAQAGRILRKSLAILTVFQQRTSSGQRAQEALYQDLEDDVDMEDARPVQEVSVQTVAVQTTESRFNRIALGLEKMHALMDLLPPVAIPTIHIAGTNGKGSVSAMLTSALTAAGLRVGTYNSPHLVTIRDSILINREAISQGSFEHRRALVEKTAQDNKLDMSPFEITTATAFVAFALASPKLDVLVIECGMGGLRDATNVLDPANQLCAILTPVDLDHQQFLGNTVEEIATDKLGILPDEGGRLVLGRQTHSSVVSFARKVCKNKSAEIYEASEPEVISEAGPTELAIKISLGDDVEEQIWEARPPLQGKHQQDNLATVLTALAVLQSSPAVSKMVPRLATVKRKTWLTGISKTRWRGRCDLVVLPSELTDGKSIRILVDGAHNALAAQHLREYIDSEVLDGDRAVTFLVGLSHSPPKTPEDVLRPMLRAPDKVVVIPFSTPVEGMPWIKNVPSAELREAIKRCGVPSDRISEAKGLRAALCELEEDETVVLTGSLYLVGDLYRLVDAA